MADTTTTTYSLVKPEVGASTDTWGTKLNTNLDSIDDLLDGTTAIAPNLTAGSWEVGGVAVTSTAAELNLLDGATVTTAEINRLDGTLAEVRTTLELGTANDVQFDSFGVGTAASGTTGEIRATNNVTAFYSSDIRLKENIVPITDALDKVNQISGVTYDWTDAYIESHGGEDGHFVRKHDVGVIAQEIEAVLPEIVGENSEGYKAVKYDRLVSLLIEAVKELSAKVEDLEGK
jgi:hypothetical protein